MSAAIDLVERAEQASACENWTVAAAAYTAALRLSPDAPPKWHYEQARALERAGDGRAAAEAFAEAVRRRRTAPAWWYFKLAGAQYRLGDWDSAATAYREAIDRRPDPVPAGWWYRLGGVYEHLERWAEAAEAYRRGCDLDPETTEAERAMLARDFREFPGRRTILRFLTPHLDRIRAGALTDDRIGPDRSDTVYSYWAQGIDNAPEIVRLCHRRLHQRSSLPVMDLDDDRMAELVQLPADIDARGIAPTHRSDLLRLELLARYGGTWLDATCLLTADPAKALCDLRTPSGWFAFTKRGVTLSTWLMTATPGHYLVRMLREALYTYWRHHDQLTHYFALHYLFEALTVLDSDFARAWSATPRLRFDEPFALRWNFAERYEPRRFDQILAGSFVHKLSYKYAPEDAVPDTMLGHLLTTF